MPVYMPVSHPKKETAYGSSGKARTGRKKTSEEQEDQREEREEEKSLFANTRAANFPLTLGATAKVPVLSRMYGGNLSPNMIKFPTV